MSENDWKDVHKVSEHSGERMGVVNAPGSTNLRLEPGSIETHISNLVKASERRFEAAFESIAEGIIYQNLEGRIVLCNEASAEILGLTIDQMEGGLLADFQLQALRGDGTPFADERHPAMIALRTGIKQSHVLMNVCKPDGTRIWIKVSSAPIFVTSSSLPVSVVTSFSDVSAMKFEEERLRIELKKFQESYSSTEERKLA